MIQFELDKCIQCGSCESACSFGALSLIDGYPVISESCVGCNQCVNACALGALSTENVEKKADISAYQNLWVIAETDPMTGKLNKVTLELLSQGRILADGLHEQLGVVLLCEKIPDQFEDAVASTGCDFAIVEEDAKYSRCSTEQVAREIAALVRKHKPSILFAAASEIGRDLAPRISAMLETGLTADCTGFDLDADGNLVQIRPTYGGSIMASIITPDHRPQMASVRPNVFQVVKVVDSPGHVAVAKCEPMIQDDNPLTEIIDLVENPSPFKSVTEAEVVLVAGYGVGSKENLAVIQRLAVEMGAALGVTRKVVDEGWAPYELQIGQTGKTVAPALYIAFGVSGALQHTIGIRNAKNIIAINQDPAAPIFTVAHKAIMGNCVKVAKEMLKIVCNKG